MLCLALLHNVWKVRSASARRYVSSYSQIFAVCTNDHINNSLNTTQTLPSSTFCSKFRSVNFSDCCLIGWTSSSGASTPSQNHARSLTCLTPMYVLFTNDNARGCLMSVSSSWQRCQQLWWVRYDCSSKTSLYIQGLIICIWSRCGRHAPRSWLWRTTVTHCIGRQRRQWHREVRFCHPSAGVSRGDHSRLPRHGEGEFRHTLIVILQQNQSDILSFVVYLLLSTSWKSTWVTARWSRRRRIPRRSAFCCTEVGLVMGDIFGISCILTFDSQTASPKDSLNTFSSAVSCRCALVLQNHTYFVFLFA